LGGEWVCSLRRLFCRLFSIQRGLRCLTVQGGCKNRWLLACGVAIKGLLLLAGARILQEGPRTQGMCACLLPS